MNNKTYYCIPDVHGMSHLLKQALDYIYELHPDGCKVIFLGDYIDRGPDNLGTVQLVMNPPKNFEFVCLKGNHEDMFLAATNSFTDFYDPKAALDLAGLTEDDVRSKSLSVLDNLDPNMIQWMSNLKLFHIEDENVFAHAFYDDSRPPANQSDHNCLWFRFMDDYQGYYNERQNLFLTHGHTPRKHGPCGAANRINLDCGAVFTGRLVIGQYEKDVRGPVNFLEFSGEK